MSSLAKFLLRWAGILALCLCAPIVMAGTLQSINIEEQGGQLDLHFHGDLPSPSWFTLDNPPRIVVDWPQTHSALASNTPGPQGSPVARVRRHSDAQRTRVTVELRRTMRAQLGWRDTFWALTLREDSPASSASATHTIAGLAPPPPTAAFNAASLASYSVESVEFAAGEAPGVGLLHIRGDSRNIQPRIEERDGAVRVSMASTLLTPSVRGQLDVSEFATPLRTILSTQNGSTAVIELTPRHGLYELSHYQSDNTITIVIAPRGNDRSAQKSFTGEPLSMNFQDIEIRSALQLLADFSGRNIVVSDSVRGSITLRLKNIPWDRALDVILTTQALSMSDSGGVIHVAPHTELHAIERNQLENRSSRESLEPVATRFFPIHYAKAMDLAGILQSSQSGESRGMLSPRGQVSYDLRTNTLLVTDTRQRLEQVERMLSKLDVPVRQVLIESRIVIASDEFERELGTRFGVGATGSSGAIGASPGATANLLQNPGTLPTDRFNINLPAANRSGTIALTLAKLPLGELLELELSAMQAEGRGEVISAPRVITTNQQRATIEQGVEVPYLKRSDGEVTVEFRNAKLELEVTPQITPDNRVIMNLRVRKANVGSFYGEGDLQIPSIDTREVSTQVLVNNGDTVVLGGIYEEMKNDELDTVPWASQLPLIGKLFRHDRKLARKSELLIFVTPKILDTGLQR